MPSLDTLTMRLDASGLAFAFIVCVLLPLAAIMKARRPSTEAQIPAGMSQRLRTVAVLIALAAIAMVVADRNDIPLFPPHQHATSHITLGTLVLVVILALTELQLRSVTLEERRKLWARQLIPADAAGRTVWLVSAVLAGATEEIIFRGVLFALLVALTGNVTVSAGVGAAAFALAHFRQGWRNMGFVAAIALLFQWLVIVTASLVPAIAVHAIYNIARGVRASRALREG
jgi:membrane protease YdiL (CAAX protease family)